MQELLMYVGIAVVVLLLLYLLAKKFSRLGDGLAFLVTLVARPFVLAEWALHKFSAYCYAAFEKSLRYPPGVTNESWFGLYVLTRLAYLFLGVCVLFGETENTLAALPVLFQIPNDISLPGVLSLASALLFLAAPALYGAVVLECYELVPVGARLFQPFAGKTKTVIGVSCILGFVLSVVVLVLFWIFRAAFLSSDADTAQQFLSPLILGGLGLTVGGASLIALWACIVGLVGLFSVCAWIVAAISNGIATILSFVPGLLDILCVYLSGGRWSVYQTIEPGEKYKVPAPRFDGYQSTTISEDTIASATSQSGFVLPEHIKEEVMNHPEKSASVVCIGSSFGSRMFPVASQKITQLGATGSLLTCGLVDVNVTHINTSLPAIVDLTPTSTQRKQALLTSNTETAAYEILLSTVGDRQVEVHLPKKFEPSVLFFFIDNHLLTASVPMLEAVSRRLPLHSIVVVTSASPVDREHDTIQQGFLQMQELYDKEIIATCCVLSPHSPFVSSFGEETQLTFAAHAFMSFLVAPRHSLNNTSFPDVLKFMRGASAFSTLSFASEVIAVGDLPKRWAWLPGIKGKVGTGDISDILTQIRRAVTRVMEHENITGFPRPLNQDEHAAIVVNVPLSLRDSRFAEIGRATSQFMNKTYPTALALTVRGNGEHYPHQFAHGFRVQASCLYPLPASVFIQPNKQDAAVSEKPAIPVLVPLSPIPGTNGQHEKKQAREAGDSVPSPARRAFRKKASEK